MANRVTLVAVAAIALGPGVARAQCQSELVHSPLRWHFADFGGAVQVEGEVAIISDDSDHTFCPTTTCSSGAVQAFRRVNGAWTVEQTIFHSRISPYDAFGRAISLDSQDRLAASAPFEDAGGYRSGAVYIFEHDGEAWRETAEILPVEPVDGVGFGGSVALRGDTLVVGAQGHPVGGIAAGAAFVYRLTDGRWEFTQKLEPPDPRHGARFSNALALDGDWLMIGAYLDDEFGRGAGAVYAYRRHEGGLYTLESKLVAPGDPEAQVFGADVALASGRMAVGASNGPTEARGAVYVFELDGGGWRHTATLEHDDPVRDDALGATVALRDDTIVAGAPRQDVPGVSYGAAYAFRRQPDGSWRQAAKLLPETLGSQFGRAIATDGASAIVGAPDETVGGAPLTGAAHIFDLGCLLCRADLDGDGELTFFDFITFGNLFAAGDMAADFDGSGALDFFDFLAFQTEFAAGCD